MADELRYILFSWPEVMQAAGEYRRQSGRPFPAGTIAKRVLRRRPKIELDIIVANSNKGESVITLDADELSAALIMFCIETRVPLPMTHSRKPIRIIGKRLALAVAIGGVMEELEAQLMGSSAPAQA